MKQLLLAVLVLTAVSCAADDDLKYQKVRTEVSVPSVNHEPSSGQLQYMAYCNAEERAFRGWPASQSSTRRRHRASTSAALRPAGPPPIMMTSNTLRLNCKRVATVTRPVGQGGDERFGF